MEPIRAIVLTTLIPIVVGCSQFNRDTEESKGRLLDYVDPFIGTAGKGKTYPGATVPYGMVQLSPDNGRNGWDWISGYYYPDDVIAGFSHTHLSGTGAGDLYDISFMPLVAPIKKQQLDTINPASTIVSHFSHNNEQASPGYYRVFLDTYNIDVELTATERTGHQRYTFGSEHDIGEVKLDLGYARNWDKTTESHVEIVNNHTIQGYRKSTGWAEDQRVYFYTQFSRPFDTFTINSDTPSQEKNSATEKAIEAYFQFDVSSNKTVEVITALSSVSTENAALNFHHHTNDNAINFDTTRALAQQQWEQELSRIIVDASKDNLIQFYTALYHSALAPRLYSDVNGEYKGPDGNIHTTGGAARYDFFSLWDTFRAQHPWKTITHPTRASDMMQSLIAHYHEYGLLPVWNFQGNETDMMMGYHAVPVLADAWFKGLLDIDGDTLLTMMRKSAEQNRADINEYRELGYVSFEHDEWNVSLTLEYAFDDYVIAKVAETLGKNDVASTYFARSQSYRNHFDPQTGFMRAKSRTGDFRLPFEPRAYHPADYCEANAWQYSFFVPHDVEGLISLYSSSPDFIAKLDVLFTTPQLGDEQPEWISGYIGQYVHGNEPAHHVPYLFRLAGSPQKGEVLLRQIMDELYTTQPDGLCGNEDAGQMSAWYLFSALGFYPVNPVSGEYVFGSPEVRHATIQLENGRQFTIDVENQNAENRYVAEIWLNDERTHANVITHKQIMQGGNLRFVMSAHPNSGVNQ